MVIIMYYMNVFFLSSFLGYLIETVMKTFFFPSMNNGILYGPWIPVYGFGCVSIVLLEKFIFEKINGHYFFKVSFLFVSVVILLTVLEWIGGNLIEICFHEVFWDYSGLKFNIGNYIALEMSLVWGVVSILFIYFIKPIEDFIIKKIPVWLTISVSILFIIDLVYTTLKLI